MAGHGGFPPLIFGPYGPKIRGGNHGRSFALPRRRTSGALWHPFEFHAIASDGRHVAVIGMVSALLNRFLDFVAHG